MAARVPKQTLVGLFKEGWDKIPEVVGSGVLAVFGFGCSIVGSIRYYQRDGDNRRFKGTYIVYRDTDPRVEKLRKD